MKMFLNIYIYIYIEKERELSSSALTPSITLSNVMPPNNLLLNSYFGNLTLNYVFYMFLTYISIFMLIIYYLLFYP